MKILIDTNIYLDFYRSKREALVLISELKNHYESIILTDQIIYEFERSRETVIKKVRQNFEIESKLEEFSSSYLQDMQEFEELLNIKRSYKTKQKQVSQKINEMLTNPSSDPIYTYFKELTKIAIDNETVIYTDSNIIQLAHKRKLVGNPPTSDKYSIGDEINWEIILANVREDIIIVGRDNTFSNNFAFLRNEYHKSTGHFIHKLTSSITEALGDIGISTSEQLKEVEGEMINDIIDNTNEGTIVENQEESQ